MHNLLQETIDNETRTAAKRKARLCLVSFMFSPVIGGAEIQTEKQARALQAAGYEVIVATLRYNKQWERCESLDGLPVIRAGGLYKRNGQLRVGRFGHIAVDINMLLTLWRARHTYDILHVFQISPLAAVAALVGKLAGKPVIINSQSADPQTTQHLPAQGETTLMADTLTKADYLKVDGEIIVTGDVSTLRRAHAGGHAMLRFLQTSNATFQALSTRSKAQLIEQGFRPTSVVHIPGSVNTDIFRPDARKHPDPRQPERAIICVARLDYAKGIDVLLHAWARLQPLLPDHLRPTLWLVGDGALKAQLTRIVSELHIQESVQFLGSRKDVLDLLQQAWAFVLPSRWEGMPNALLEAMACGLPCVATTVSGSEDLISNNDNGLLVPPEQPAELALALCRVITDADFAQHLGTAARTTVEREYQLSHIVNQCAALYARLLYVNNPQEVRDV